MDIFWGVFAFIVYLTMLYAGKEIMAKLDNLNAALASIDTATTQLAAELADLSVRVTNDDISDADLQAAIDHASALAGRISDASAAVAGIEAVDVPVPPVEDPTEEPDNGGVVTDPVVTDPFDPGTGEPTDPTQPTP